MKIEGIYLDGFGHFGGQSIGPLNHDLTVLSGANESGKSTLLAFIRTVLFGFPARLSDQHYPPLRGGNHGGRLTIVDDDGRRYVVERYRGVRGGPVAVRDEDGDELDGSALSGLLSTPGELFQAVYAFGLDELQDVDSLDKEAVRARIYSAGIGAAGLPLLMRQVSDRMMEIFRPSGQNQPVAKTLRELQDVKSQLAEQAAQAAEFGELTSRQESIATQLAEANATRAALRARESELEGYEHAWQELAPITRVEHELKDLPSFDDFPEDAIQRLDRWEGQIQEVNGTLLAEEDKLAKAKKAAEAAIEDEGLLEEQETIETILRRRGSFDDSLGDLPDREDDLTDLEIGLREVLQELGPDWDETRLSEFVASVSLRDEVDIWIDRWERSVQEVRNQEAEVEHTQREDGEASEDLAEAQRALDDLDAPQLDVGGVETQKANVRRGRSRLDEMTRARHQRENIEIQLAVSNPQSVASGTRASWPIPAFLVLVGLAALIVGLVVGGQQVAVAIGGVAVVAGLAAYLVEARSRPSSNDFSSSQSVISRRLEEAREEESNLNEALVEVGQALGLVVIDSDALDRVEDELGKASDAIRSWIRCRDDLRRLEQKTGRASERLLRPQP